MALGPGTWGTCNHRQYATARRVRGGRGRGVSAGVPRGAGLLKHRRHRVAVGRISTAPGAAPAADPTRIRRAGGDLRSASALQL